MPTQGACADANWYSGQEVECLMSDVCHPPSDVCRVISDIWCLTFNTDASFLVGAVVGVAVFACIRSCIFELCNSEL